MANSKYAYVRDFELPDPLLPGVFMVLRIDGHSFHRFSEKHNFAKPNDVRALQLMDHAAQDLMEEYPDVVLGFGESDEFSFLLRKSTSLYNRRHSKIVSTLTSLFTSSYVFHWSRYFPDTPLGYPPSFDGRIVLYPGTKEVKDYFAWRQADTHINNLYNTTFWALVQQGGQTTTEAHSTLRGTFAKDKHEILFSRFGINYNQLDAQFRKGSVLVREDLEEEKDGEVTKEVIPDEGQYERTNVNVLDNEPVLARSSKSDSKQEKTRKGKARRPKSKVVMLHCDIIKDEFWEERSGLLVES